MDKNVIVDVSTVVSIIPYEIPINLNTVFPSRYTIPAAKEGEFSHIYVTRGRTDLYVDSDRGFVSRPILSEEIANAIVNDYIKKSISVVIGTAEPGIFLLAGEATIPVIAMSQQLKLAREKQKNWYIKLIEEADVTWNKTGNPRAVGQLARLAAHALNVKRQWDVETVVADSERKQCPMCMSAIMPQSVICMVCKFIINKEEYNKHKGEFALIGEHSKPIG